MQGPAVYSNPSMYFYPDSGDAEGIEILKGAASIGTDQEQLVVPLTIYPSVPYQEQRLSDAHIWR